jgi:Fur family ferric uptake transcriptional regulator
MSPNIETMLIEKGIQPTAMRMLVLDCLLKQSSATPLTELESELHPADRITIYRTLKTFEEKGMVHAIDDGSGATKYAICVEDCSTTGHHDLHVHFNCNICKQTTCLPNTSVPELKLPEGFVPAELSLIVKGVCPGCSNK